MTPPRRLARPRRVSLQAGPGGVPRRVGRAVVENVVEDWLVEDRWWTDQPLRRRYLELVLADGSCVVVFRDLVSGRWYSQRD